MEFSSKVQGGEALSVVPIGGRELKGGREGEIDFVKGGVTLFCFALPFPALDQGGFPGLQIGAGMLSSGLVGRAG